MTIAGTDLAGAMAVTFGDRTATNTVMSRAGSASARDVTTITTVGIDIHSGSYAFV
ncbi:MAG: hypothetical protein JWO59_1581 [Chloroflexi bacterium]|nr:hypothetical protein [Chloroflexota bacterium]